MNTIILALFMMLGSQVRPMPNTPNMPKNNPDGVWVTESGAKFKFALSGKDLKVELVDGKSKYLKYDLSLKNQEEVNTYTGSGSFVARLSNGKECKFNTEWTVTVVMAKTVFVNYNRITPNPDTCAILEVVPDQMLLSKEETPSK